MFSKWFSSENTNIITTEFGNITIINNHYERVDCYKIHLNLIAKNLVSIFSKSPLFKSDKQMHEIMSQLVNSFAQVFDKNLMLCMDNDIKDYCKEKNIDVTRMSATECKNAFRQYLKDQASLSKTKTYGDYLFNKYLHVKELYDTMTKNFIANITKLVDRVKNDLVIIQEGYLTELKEPIQLVAIKSTGSDFHLQGNQVYILEFGDQSGKCVKVVYKPTSVVPDAMIVGNSSLLSKLDPIHYQDHKSMISIFNESLAISDKTPLPTYLIIPREDQEYKETDIHRHYGYCEFLTHKPWFEIDYNQILEIEMGKVDPGDRKKYLEFMIPPKKNPLFTIPIEQSQDNLKTAAESSDTDYITDKQAVVDQYSYDCGVLVTLMLTTSLVDGHLGNLIIHQSRPYIIDTESCFSCAPLNIKAMACLDPSLGSMSANSFSTETSIGGACLFDLAGLHEMPANQPEKNLLFFKSNPDTLSACQLNYDLFKAGFAQGLLIATMNPNVQQWFSQEQVKNMPIRIVPFVTNHFHTEFKNMVKYNFDENKFKELCTDVLKQYDYFHNREWKSFKMEEYVNAILPFSIPTANQLIYSGNILEEYKTGSIPFYYTFAAQKHLYDFNGNIIPFTDSYYQLRSKLYPDSKQEFLVMSPIEYTKKRLDAMQNPSTQAMITNLVNQELLILQHKIKTDPSEYINIVFEEENILHKLFNF